ncbi:hypothetical protein ACO22_04489 [Paracoccidioides brasiliensis]|uniref:FAD-binding domain-containing protein n=1 Tax=Paracoccidioides brasiliensis TaxID=121759 RepID=A0A1D2JCY1_PARBR|nr:hypothetical protein ACO22_04489 [Paracoccidioides brasiliensis]
MPTLSDFSATSRELRVLPLFASPLPRLSPKFEPQLTEQLGGENNGVEKYEVVISGAGPAGLMLELLLARYGLSDTSLLCLDPKPSSLKSGQADGLQPRTLEVLKSLGLANEILTEGCQMWQVAFWNPTADPELVAQGRLIERTSIVPDICVPARFPHEVTIHQGRIERIFEDNLLKYSKRGVQRSSMLVGVKIDEEGDPEFPVIAQIDVDGVRRTIRTKHLVGADGARSTVRNCMGLRLQGDWTDHVWGVVDFVADTDFPDIRRRTAIHSPVGSVMVIPREQIANGDYLTRLYVQVHEDVNPENGQYDGSSNESAADAKTRRNKVTPESILKQVQSVLKPYYIKPKDNEAVDWWTAYQIGQRVADKFIVKDSKGVQRVFIVGDACHTHSPKAGQGMNVSMMDAYNVAWKLAYYINGLTPASIDNLPDPILDTYHEERHTVAQQLIEFDKSFSSMFSGKIGAANVASGNGANGLSHDQFLDVFNTGNGFTSGCGIEYPENPLVEKNYAMNPIENTDYLSGILRPGRRLLNVRAKRHADGSPRDLQDDFPSTARFRILLLTSNDLLSPTGISAAAIRSISGTLLTNTFPASILELVVVHPELKPDFLWEEVPGELKKHAEMRFYDGSALQDVYATYGVPADKGVIAVVRPDGYVGVLAALDDVQRAESYFSKMATDKPIQRGSWGLEVGQPLFMPPGDPHELLRLSQSRLLSLSNRYMRVD